MQSLTGFSLSPQQITDIINHVGGTSTYYPRFRLLDRTLTPVAVPGTDNADDPADMTQWVQTASITNDTTQPVHRSMALAFSQIPGLAVNTLNHLVEVRIRYVDNPVSNTTLFEMPRGIFCFGVPERDIQDHGNTITATMPDLTGKIARLVFENSYAIATGSNVVDAIKTLLRTDYKPLSLGGTGATPDGLDMAGPNIGNSRINITASSATLPTSILFKRGDNVLSAINQLLEAINYYPLWVDERGVFQSSPRPIFSQSSPSIGWTYNCDATTSVVHPGIRQSFNNQEAIGNIAMVQSENTGGSTFFSIKYNQLDSSPISLQNLQEAWPLPLIDDSTIPTQAMADDRATIALTRAAMLGEQLDITTFINPAHQSHDFLILNCWDNTGAQVVQSTAASPFEEIAWTEDLVARTQTHTLQRVIFL